MPAGIFCRSNAWYVLNGEGRTQKAQGVATGFAPETRYNEVMKTSVSAKRCPECGKVTMLHATECVACGHRFRTRFEEPAERTEAFDAVMLPRPPVLSIPPAAPRRRRLLSTFALAFLGSFCLVAMVGLMMWGVWSVSQGNIQPLGGSATVAPPVVSALKPSSYSSARHGRAEDLYERIDMAMSLYDVDQVAGGMGRVVHSSDPHVLLLSYDYTDQSVRVSLYRGDLTGDDYRVQAVALYHGNRLLQRHADDN